MEINVMEGFSSFLIKNKFRVLYGLGEIEFKPLAIKLSDMNWSWIPLRRGFFRSMEKL
jgi:hypothetical protein